MRIKHLIALSGSSRAVLDHRLMNWMRQVKPLRVDILYNEVLGARSHKTGQSYLEVLEEALAELGPVHPDLVWTNIPTLESATLLAWAKAEHGALTILDNDDLLTDLPEWNPAANAKGRFRQEGLAATAREALVRTNSTPLLQQENGGLLCSNFADPENWVAPPDMLPNYKHGRIDIVCPISASRVAEWEEMCAPAFVELAGRYPQIRWWFMGGWPVEADTLPAGQIVRINWSPVWLYKRMVGWIQPDIILSPLAEHRFNVAKSNIKFLEAGVSGGTIIGSPVGELARTVTDGHDGLLTNDFEAAVSACVEDRVMLRELQANCRQTVLTKWTWPAVESQWMEALQCPSL